MDLMECTQDRRVRGRRWLPLPRVSLPLLGLGAITRAAVRTARGAARRRRAGTPIAAGSRFSATSARVPFGAGGGRTQALAVASLTAALPPLGATSDAAAAIAEMTSCRPPAAVAAAARPGRQAAPRAAAAAAASAGPAASKAAASKVGVKPATRPASDVLAGALARAASQSIIHPLDTLKVRLQANMRAAGAPPAPSAGAAAVPLGVSKFGKLVPPPGAAGVGPGNLRAAGARIASLYKGVVGAASGAGIAIGAYFAFYSTACNLLAAHTSLSPGAVAFVGGAAAAAGSSVVKVPLAVCIRSVQAGVYPNVFAAASSITKAAGPAGLFTGYWPTLLEDVPDMACKFAAYESMRQLHRRLVGGRDASPHEDFAMGALAGAAAAAATTPLDVVKTRMMCTAASRPTMAGAAAAVLATGGPGAFFSGVGARALSNGINSAVFFCAFEAIRGTFQKQCALAPKAAVAAPATAAAAAPAAAAPALQEQRALVPKVAFAAAAAAAPGATALAAGAKAMTPKRVKTEDPCREEDGSASGGSDSGFKVTELHGELGAGGHVLHVGGTRRGGDLVQQALPLQLTGDGKVATAITLGALSGAGVREE